MNGKCRHWGAGSPVPAGDSRPTTGPGSADSRPAPASRGVPSEYALIRAHGGSLVSPDRW